MKYLIILAIFYIFNNLFASDFFPKFISKESYESVMNDNDFLFENILHKDVIDAIINYERTPKITFYSELKYKKVIFNLDEIDKRIKKLNTRLKNNITFLSEYSIEFDGHLSEIDKFISTIIYDNEVKFSIMKAMELKLQFENLYNNKEMEKFNIYKTKYEDNEYIIKYSIIYNPFTKTFKLLLG